MWLVMCPLNPNKNIVIPKMKGDSAYRFYKTRHPRKPTLKSRSVLTRIKGPRSKNLKRMICGERTVWGLDRNRTVLPVIGVVWNGMVPSVTACFRIE